MQLSRTRARVPIERMAAPTTENITSMWIITAASSPEEDQRHCCVINERNHVHPRWGYDFHEAERAR